ncbi:ferric reductase NAD binding domain-containing protein [Limtongia smithiae]|uniref:ferric reductase NAD binding domain-containing protein n=1 Tax=Limtongia smithiae TaxID=1125753 RepID=UPI0034CD3C7A
MNRKENKYVTKFRQMFMLPALFNGRHVQPLTIGKFQINALHVRWHYYALFGFYALNIIFSFTTMDVFSENLNSTVSGQWREYIEIRSGVIATVLCIPTYLFGSRNNVLMYLSGWSFETFNVFHRHVGFWMMWQSAIHGIAYTVQYVMNDSYARVWSQANIVTGTVATLLAGIMVIFAAFPFRHYFYETFLVFHIALAAAFARYCWDHVCRFGYEKYMYAMVAVWAFDRFARLVRIAVHGVYLNAELTVVGDIMAVNVKPWFDWKPKPGQYAYIYIADPRYKFWESHPFSVMESRDGTYRFLIAKESGLTKTLFRRAIKNSSGSTTSKVRVMIEGWYGEEPPIARYDTVMIVGGGIGVTAAISTALDLVHRARANQHISFYWVVRGRETLSLVQEQLNELARASNIDMHIFVRPGTSNAVNVETGSFSEKTAGASSGEDSDSTGSISEKNNAVANIPIITDVRPDFEQIIPAAIAEAPGSFAAFTCGPGTLVDSCRRAVTANADKGRGRVDYFEDAFSWA